MHSCDRGSHAVGVIIHTDTQNQDFRVARLVDRYTRSDEVVVSKLKYVLELSRVRSIIHHVCVRGLNE